MVKKDHNKFDSSKFWNKNIPWYKNFYFTTIKINGLLLFIIILFMAWSYQYDISAYKEVYEDACSYCDVQAICEQQYIGDDLLNKQYTKEYTLGFSQNQNTTGNNT